MENYVHCLLLRQPPHLMNQALFSRLLTSARLKRPGAVSREGLI